MGGGDTQTTTQQTSYAPWTQAYQQALAGMGMGMNSNFMHAPQYNVAGFTVDQQKGMDSIRDVLGQYGPGGMGLPTVDQMQQGGMARAVNASPARASAQQLGANEFEQFMNPFLQNVLDPAIANLNRDRREREAEIGAKAAASNAWGGSGEALQKAQLDRSHGETVASMASNLMAQGYDRATANAMANAQMRQQTEMQNAQMAQQAEMANAQMGTHVNLANANNNLASYGMMNNLQNSDFQRQMAVIQALLGSGQQQQNLAQTALNVPFYAYDRMNQPPVWPLDQTTVATQPDNSPGRGQSLLGLGASILGAPITGGGSLIGGLLGF